MQLFQYEISIPNDLEVILERYIINNKINNDLLKEDVAYSKLKQWIKDNVALYKGTEFHQDKVLVYGKTNEYVVTNFYLMSNSYGLKENNGLLDFTIQINSEYELLNKEEYDVIELYGRKYFLSNEIINEILALADNNSEKINNFLPSQNKL